MLQATGHGFQAFQTIVENVTDMKTNWDYGGFYRVEWDRAQLRITFFGPRKRQTNRHLAWRPATRKMIYKGVSKINVIERNTQLCATTHFNGTLKKHGMKTQHPEMINETLRCCSRGLACTDRDLTASNRIRQSGCD